MTVASSPVRDIGFATAWLLVPFKDVDPLSAVLPRWCACVRNPYGALVFCMQVPGALAHWCVSGSSCEVLCCPSGFRQLLCNSVPQCDVLVLRSLPLCWPG